MRKHLRSTLANFALALLASTPAGAEVPFTPYGMDAIPSSKFYSGPWNHYGSDPVPRTETDHGFHGAYGLDGIPDSAVPHLHRLKDVLPAQHLQVLTRAIEQSTQRQRSDR